MKEINLANDIQKDYVPKNFYELLKLGVNGYNIIGYLKDLAELYENRQQECLICELIDRICKLEEITKELKMGNFNTIEAEGLLNYSLIKVKLCHKKEQIIKMRDIIMAALADNIISCSDAEVLIDIVSTLNTKEAEVFLNIYNQLTQNQKYSDLCNIEFNYIDNENKGYEDLFDMLISKSLIKRIIYPSDLTWDGKTPLHNYRYKYTYYGVLFLKVIYKADC